MEIEGGVEPEQKAERDHWFNVMRTFLCYEDFFAAELDRQQRHINKLPEKIAKRLPSITFDKLTGLKNASDCNLLFFEDMVDFHYKHAFGGPQKDKPRKDNGPAIHPAQQHRNQAVLHSLYREWSAAGAQERSQSFSLLVKELKIRLPVYAGNAYKQRVLVPGCGLGRLPVEITAAGYACEGNEYSAYMAIASNFILNGIIEKECYDIFPWISTLCNIAEVKDTMQTVLVPDATANSLISSFDEAALPPLPPPPPPPPSSVSIKPQQHPQHETNVSFPKFSFSAGSFTEVYGACSSSPSQPDDFERFDAVVTCFFLDTGPVALEYIEKIWEILPPGGVWINQGPLLYHWVADIDSNNDPRYAQSIELSYEEIKHVIKSYGFEYLNEEWKECNYTRCNESMMWTTYRTIFFTVQKPFSNASDI